MTMSHGMCARGCWLLLAAGLVVGCQEGDWDFGPKKTEPEPPPAPLTANTDPLVLGSVGAETLVADASTQPLRGFGLVVGLAGKGSSDCPTTIRDYLVDYLTKKWAGEEDPERKPAVTPGTLIDSADTAVVEVTAIVPAGARKGARMDVQVAAIPGTSTESLEGGLLLPTELRYYDVAASGQGLIAGRVLAEAAGPLFVDPGPARAATNTPAGGAAAATTSGSADTPAGGSAEGTAGAPPTATFDPRRARVLGGGRALEARPLRFVLIHPGYSRALQIERRLNERFGQKPKVANAESQGYVVLETPLAYAGRPELLRRLAAHVFLDTRPAATKRKLQELFQLAANPQADLDRIGLAWEGLGTSILPELQPLYAHVQPALRYYAARTGARLGDLSAVPVVAAAAANGADTDRLAAIRELGDLKSPQAAGFLVPLLADAVADVRIGAYEALLDHRHPVVDSVQFRLALDPKQLGFILDLVDTQGPPLLYARRTRFPRIAVFGARLALDPPVFYSRPDGSVTIHTVEGSDDLRVYARFAGRLSEEIAVPPRVADLVRALGDLPEKDKLGQLRGLGLPYSEIVHVLSDLCAQGMIPAKFVLELTPTAELTPGTERPEAERPEGERPESDRKEGERPESERPDAAPAAPATPPAPAAPATTPPPAPAERPESENH